MLRVTEWKLEGRCLLARGMKRARASGQFADDADIRGGATAPPADQIYLHETPSSNHAHDGISHPMGADMTQIYRGSYRKFALCYVVGK